MDINSLLSPQETPRPTPTPPIKTTSKKPRKPRTPKVSQPSPLANTTLAPQTIPQTSIVHSHHHTAPSPANISPTMGHRVSVGSVMSSPLADSTLRTTRQPSTAGMDTLADLASMQHHQQTARANSGRLRSAEIYDNPTSTSSVLPNLMTMPRPQVSNQLREPPLSRGDSMDIAMVDGSSETPPRKYSTSALSPEELEMVTHLADYLKTNPFAYDSHVQLINLLHRGLQNHAQGEPQSYNLLPDLQNARETMSASFALGEDLWDDWIKDQMVLAKSLEDRITVMELCQKAVEEEPNSAKLWESYGQFTLYLYKSANPEDENVAEIGVMSTSSKWSEEDVMVGKEVFSWQQMMAVWERGSKETLLRLNDSHLLWDTYTDLLLHQLASSPSQDAIAQTQFHFVTRLQTAHATWDKTLEAYSSFVSRYDNANYENTMVAATRLGAEAKAKSSAREMMEIGVLRASQAEDRDLEIKACSEYLEWELAQSRKKNIFDFGLASALYQRATLRFPSRTELWEGYAMFLIEASAHGRQDISAFPVLERATRHCPWSGTLWSQYLLAAENKKLSFTEVEDIKHRATSSGLLDAGGMDEILKVQTAWCGFLRRRALQPDFNDEDMDVAEVGIRSAIENMENLGIAKHGPEYQGDPEYRLEKIYIKCLSQGRYWDNARDEFKKLIPRRGDSYDFWTRYYLWEMGTWGKLAFGNEDPNARRLSKPTEATKVLVRAMARPKLDWPEKIIEIYQYHCEDNEDAEELQSSKAQIWKAKKNVQKRREKESYEAYEAAQAQIVQQQQLAQYDMIADPDEGEKASKRKREEESELGSNKRVRPGTSGEAQSLPEEHPSASSLLKRDRENATVVVKNLPIHTTETRLRQYFRDCGIINSLKILPETDGESASASIEFDSKEDVLTAQTKDMKTIDGQAIQVLVGSESTLYVCNFPPTADEAWIQKTFSKYGEIVDIRFPSLKFDTHRRFCYVQFKSSSEAHAATQLNGEDMGGKLRLLTKISDPKHKQERQGATYEGRELYLANLDWHATSEEIRTLFSKYGTIEKVRIPKKIDGSSRGFGYVVFSNKGEAEAALELNLLEFKHRVLNVMISSNDKSKRQETRIITSTSQRSTASPGLNHSIDGSDGDRLGSGSPIPPAATTSKYVEILSRTIALMGIPDTVNEARIRAIAEPYGELVKVSLRLDHQGVILEYTDVASVGKASLGLEGQEIAPGRPIRVGTVNEMKQQRGEFRSDKIATGAAAKREVSKMQGPAPIRRPMQSGARRGGRGGLGLKRGGGGSSGERATKDAEGNDAEASGQEEGGEEKGKAKSNADFKAMFLKEGPQE